jgi:hypothetical protein
MVKLLYQPKKIMSGTKGDTLLETQEKTVDTEKATIKTFQETTRSNS